MCTLSTGKDERDGRRKVKSDRSHSENKIKNVRRRIAPPFATE